MTVGRRCLVHVVILIILAGSLRSILLSQEAWPFSPYGMLASVNRTDVLVQLRLFGILAEDPAREIPLVRSEQITPFDASRLTHVLWRLAGVPNRGLLTKEAIRDCLRRYEQRRRAGLHSGPALRGVRLYKVEWRIDRRHPSSEKFRNRILLEEVTLDGIAG